MPYNIPDKYGGDSKENTSWMEDCVNSITGINKRTRKPYTEQEKIAICKAMLMRKKSKDEAEAEINSRINQCIVKLMRAGRTFIQAENEVLALLNKYNYDFDRVIENI